MSEPENVATSYQATVSTDVKPQQYKCLLHHLSQKVLRQLPMYQSLNEGSGHVPKFRCTVWVDGVSYTSPNTYQQRKLAEMDASRIAYFAILQKLKNEASRLVCEDKSFCKSIVADYAARMNIQKPTYQTTQLDMPLPVFRSSLVFGDVTCTGENNRSKKEAEQSAARAVILKYLDCDSGIILSEIIKSKFKHYAKMMDLQRAYNDTIAVMQHGTGNGHNNSLETGHTHEVSTQAPISATPEPTLLAQAPFAGNQNGANEVMQHGLVNGSSSSSETGDTQVVSTEALTPASTVLAPAPFDGTHNSTNEVGQPGAVNGLSNSLETGNTQEVSTQALTPAIPVPTVLGQTICTGTLNGTNEVVQSGTVNALSNSLETGNIQEVSTEAITPAILVSTVLAQTKCVGTLNVISEVVHSETVNGLINSVETGHIQEVSTQATTPAIPVSTVLAQTKCDGTLDGTNEVVQSGTISGLSNNLETGYIQEVSTQELTPAIQRPTVLAQTSFSGTQNAPTCSIISAPSLEKLLNIPAANPSDVVQLTNSEVSTVTVNQHPTSSPAVAQTNFVSPTSGKKRNRKNNEPCYSVISALSLGQLASIPATHPSNIVKPENSEASPIAAHPLPMPSPAEAQMNVVGATSSKKRNRKNKRRARKKMRVEDQSPIAAIPLNQVPAFSAQ